MRPNSEQRNCCSRIYSKTRQTRQKPVRENTRQSSAGFKKDQNPEQPHTHTHTRTDRHTHTDINQEKLSHCCLSLSMSVMSVFVDTPPQKLKVLYGTMTREHPEESHAKIQLDQLKFADSRRGHTGGGSTSRSHFLSEQPPHCSHQKCISLRRSASSSARLPLTHQTSNSFSSWVQ